LLLIAKPGRVVLLGIVISLVLLAGCGGDEANETKETKQELTPEQQPKILDMPEQKMAVVYTTGDPTITGAQAVPALYASVSALVPQLKEKGIDFQLQAVRARWPDMSSSPKNQWTGIWGLPIPDAVDSLSQKTPGTEVKIEVWDYGKIAQILHIGPYATEEPTIKRLMGFIDKSGYEIAGIHEEIYLTPPNVPEQKTIILYPIKKK
jgi:hypothetical protein